MRLTLRILKLQVASSQMSVDQSRLPTAHTAQNTLRRNIGGKYQFGVKSHSTVLFEKLCLRLPGGALVWVDSLSIPGCWCKQLRWQEKVRIDKRLNVRFVNELKLWLYFTYFVSYGANEVPAFITQSKNIFAILIPPFLSYWDLWSLL